MTIGAIREDGYPQATTVSYVNDDLTIYFGCAVESQKADNIGRCSKGSLAVNLPYSNWSEIRGLSIVGRAEAVSNPKKIDRVGQLMLQKFPQIAHYALTGMEGKILFRLTAEIITVLDYRKGFGHTTRSSGFSPTGFPIYAASRRS